MMKIEAIMKLAEAVYGNGCSLTFQRDEEDEGKMTLTVVKDGRLKKRHVAGDKSVSSDMLLLIEANELRASLEQLVKDKHEELRKATMLFEQATKEDEK